MIQVRLSINTITIDPGRRYVVFNMLRGAANILTEVCHIVSDQCGLLLLTGEDVDLVPLYVHGGGGTIRDVLT